MRWGYIDNLMGSSGHTKTMLTERGLYVDNLKPRFYTNNLKELGPCKDSQLGSYMDNVNSFWVIYRQS